jgi:hypothetical protein
MLRFRDIHPAGNVLSLAGIAVQSAENCMHNITRTLADQPKEVRCF